MHLMSRTKALEAPGMSCEGANALSHVEIQETMAAYMSCEGAASPLIPHP
jgi:hypothetical protein